MTISVTIQTAPNGSTDSATGVLTQVQAGFDTVCTEINGILAALGLTLSGDAAQQINGASSSALLSLKQTGTGPSLLILSSADLETMTVTPDGKVTIGDKPTAGLFENNAQVAVVGGASALRSLLLAALGDDAEGFTLSLYKTRSADPDARNSVALDDSLGRIVWLADAGASTEEAASISAEVDGTILEAVTISTISRTSNVVTVVTSAAHNMLVGDLAAIEGCIKDSFNVDFTVASVPDSTTLTFAQVDTNDSDTTGTVAKRNMPTRLIAALRRSNTSAPEEVLRIGSDRVVTLQAGIKFPATQAASSDVNTLDDYEEGSFTPRIDGSTTAGTGTYVSRGGRYTKIGNRVVCHGYIEWSAHTGTGSLRIANLPFTSLGPGYGGFDVAGSVAFSGLTYTSHPMLRMFTAHSFVYLTQAASNAAESNVSMDSAATITFSISYEVST